MTEKECEALYEALEAAHKILPGTKERCVISSFQIAESMGFKGDFRHWEELLRIGGLLAL
jgi:hypothetical protein